MTNKKMTKRDYFNSILSKYPLTDEEKAFVEHELELLAKKNASEKKPTAQQTANEAIKEVILRVLTDADNMMTVSEIIKADPALSELTNQRVSALLRQMIGTTVVRIEDKRKAYFQAM